MVCPGLVGIGDPRTMKLSEGMTTQGLPESPHPEYTVIFSAAQHMMLASSMEPCLASGSYYASAYHGSPLSFTRPRAVNSPRQEMLGVRHGVPHPRTGVEEPGGPAHRHQTGLLGNGWRLQVSCL